MDFVMSAIKNTNFAVELKDWIEAIAVGFMIACVIHAFIAELFIVDGSSMNPTLQSEERVLVSKFPYFLDKPQKNDIIVFETKYGDQSRHLIKRIIATGGDTIEIRSNKVYVNDQVLDEDYILEATKTDYPKTTVPEGTVFAMGDNRNNSLDSRFSIVGFVKLSDISGRADAVIWPLPQARKF